MDVECPVCGRTFPIEEGECPFCGNPMTLACFNDLQETADFVKEALSLEDLSFGQVEAVEGTEEVPEAIVTPPVEEGGKKRFRLFGR